MPMAPPPDFLYASRHVQSPTGTASLSVGRASTTLVVGDHAFDLLQHRRLTTFGCCAAKHYPAAVVAYTEAIHLNPSGAAYYSNRAFAHVRLENYGSAVADASKALELDPRFTKVRSLCLRDFTTCAFEVSKFPQTASPHVLHVR